MGGEAFGKLFSKKLRKILEMLLQLLQLECLVCRFFHPIAFLILEGPCQPCKHILNHQNVKKVQGMKFCNCRYLFADSECESQPQSSMFECPESCL